MRWILFNHFSLLPPQQPLFFFFPPFSFLIWIVSLPTSFLNLFSSIFSAIVVNNSYIHIEKYVDAFALFSTGKFKQGINGLSVLFGLIERDFFVIGFIDLVTNYCQNYKYRASLYGYQQGLLISVIIPNSSWLGKSFCLLCRTHIGRLEILGI